MFAPDVWPSYFSKAFLSDVYDLDNRKFLDMSIMGVGACILGYAYPDVDKRVKEAIDMGVSSTLICPEEVDLAKVILDLHPWFDMVRYARGGGEAMSIAVRIARASTKKDIVLFSGYHGWTDWYLSANLVDNENLDGQLMPGLDAIGVPMGLKGTAIPFDANDIQSLLNKIKGLENKIGAIVIEPARGEDASPDYLADLKSLSEDIGCKLIFDEITSGFRACVGGIHRKYGVNPDIAVFAKSVANGYPISIIAGRSDSMNAFQKSFISSTNWTDRLGPVAALATIESYIDKKVDLHINNQGKKVKKIWEDYAKEFEIDIDISGLDSLAAFKFNSKNSTKMNTLFTIEMLKMGVLAFRQFKPSLSHTDNDILYYEKCVEEAFRTIASDPDCSKLDTEEQHLRFKYLTKE